MDLLRSIPLVRTLRRALPVSAGDTTTVPVELAAMEEQRDRLESERDEIKAHCARLNRESAENLRREQQLSGEVVELLRRYEPLETERNQLLAHCRRLDRELKKSHAREDCLRLYTQPTDEHAVTLAPEKLANIRLFREEIASPEPDGRTSNSPLLLVVETTTRCNSRCVHCPRPLDPHPAATLSWSDFRAVLPGVRAAFELYLFGDGEVLLDIPRHMGMLARIHRVDPACSLGFSTNGRLLTPEVYELYANAGIGFIQLSLNAASSPLYESLSPGGSLSRLVSSLEQVAALRQQCEAPLPQLHLATVISRENYRELPRLAEFACKYGFRYWYINAEYPYNPGREPLQLSGEDIAELQAIERQIVSSYSTHFVTLFDASIGLERHNIGEWPAVQSLVFCTVPWQRFELKANGDVILCPYYCQPVCSIRGRSLHDVWNGPEFRHIRQTFLSRTTMPSCCRNCNLDMRRQYLPGFPGMPQ